MNPRGDQILDLCKEIKAELREELVPGDLGAFVREWAELEAHLVEAARRQSERNVSAREAISVLTKSGIFSPELAHELNALRSFRNSAVHRPETVKPSDLGKWLGRIRELARVMPLRKA